MNTETPRDRSFEDLEWSELCQAIASRTYSDLGRERALALQPADDEETARTRLSVMAEVLSLRESGAVIPAGGARDVLAIVARLEREAAASGEELSAVNKLLGVALELDRFGASHEESAPLLGRVLAVDSELSLPFRELSEALNEEGEVLDSASPGLATARAATKSLRVQMQRRIEELIRRYREALQDAYFAERDGRYVLPVRADAPFRVEGIVLGTSSSGSTLYVEPKEVGQLGNQLRMAQVEVEREVALVLARLSASLTPYCPEIAWAQDVCARADLLRACADFSAAIGAQVVPFAEPGTMQLVDAKHPLLCLSGIDVVPSDLSVAPDHGLVLSGPNAGGKTVALKTLGLLALMQATGLAVPATEESRIGFFHEVYSDIGDDQSLSMSLSTFSGHVTRVRQILDDSGHGTLVLFDELMGGTDPDEGAVLAIATIDALVEAGAAVCVTTHYEPLKEHASSVVHLENGAVGFDFDRMEPTFKVEMGRPGASSALIVAEKHGLPSRVTQKALALLPELKVEKRAAHIEAEAQAVQLQNERAELKKLRAEQELLNRQLALSLEKQKEARRRDLSRESDELRSEVRSARAEVRRLRQVMKSASPAELRKAEGELDRAASVAAWGGKVDKELRPAQVSEAALPPPQKIKPGDQVRVRGFSVSGEVLEAPKKGHVRVLLGVMKMNVALADLEQVKGAPARPQPQVKKKKEAPIVSEFDAPIRSEDVTLDLRGRRVEESLLEVDHFVDELLRNQERGGFVLHGHGTGALKESVRSHLRAHRCVVSSRPAERDEGGDAFTVFWLSVH